MYFCLIFPHLYFWNLIAFQTCRFMSLPTNLSDEEMLQKAQGVDVLSPERCQELMEKPRKKTQWRIRTFFNTRDGWLLRRIVRGHRLQRIKLRYCVLCAHNVLGCVRAKTAAMCGVCHIALCTIPREGEEGISCFEEWHAKDRLVRR